jgi:hypothetical protein
LFTTLKNTLLRPFLRLLEHPQVKSRVADMVLETLGQKRVQIELWKATNIRPTTLLTHWSLQPNDIREELMRQATADAARFVGENMCHVEGAFDPPHLLDLAIDAVTVDGLYLEFGVYTATTINHIASRVSKTIHGFDSFEGLPEDWGGVPTGKFNLDGKPPTDVRDNVELHAGWFDQTLPAFLEEHEGSVALLHVDCDLYSSTRTVLWNLADRIIPGTVIVFDEYFNYPGWREHEFKAFEEFVSEFKLDFEYLGYAARGYSVSVLIKSSEAAEAAV